MTHYPMKGRLESLERARVYLIQALSAIPYYCNQHALEDLNDDIRHSTIYIYGKYGIRPPT